MEKGKGKWVRIICAYSGCCLCLNETKKGGETSNSSNFKKGNIGMANMHKKQRRQDRDGLVMMTR